MKEKTAAFAVVIGFVARAVGIGYVTGTKQNAAKACCSAKADVCTCEETRKEICRCGTSCDCWNSCAVK